MSLLDCGVSLSTVLPEEISQPESLTLPVLDPDEMANTGTEPPPDVHVELSSGACDFAQFNEQHATKKRKWEPRPPAMRRARSDASSNRSHDKEEKSKKQIVVKKKQKTAASRVKPEYAENTKSLKASFQKQQKEKTKEQMKDHGPRVDPWLQQWNPPAMFNKPMLDSYLAPVLADIKTSLHPGGKTLTRELAQRVFEVKARVDLDRVAEWRKNGNWDFAATILTTFDRVVRDSKDRDVVLALSRQVSTLACTYYQDRPSQVFSVSRGEIKALGAFAFNLCEQTLTQIVPGCGIRSEWKEISLWTGIEPHPLHVVKNCSCSRLIWLISYPEPISSSSSSSSTSSASTQAASSTRWRHQGLVVDTCRGEACFYPPLELQGVKCRPLLLVLKAAIADKVAPSFLCPEEAVIDQVQKITSKPSTFVYCGGMKVASVTHREKFSSVYADV
jgi:hypothetical protein